MLQLSCDYISGVPAREQQAKDNLGQIKQAIDRYYSDWGEYPPILLGGSNESWSRFYARGGDARITDPQIRNGYLAEYPKNPFTSDTQGLQYLTMTGGDTNVPGSGDPRFGMFGTGMANIVDDPLWLTTKAGEYASTINRSGSAQIFNYGSFGGVRDDQGKAIRRTIPGCFFYRATSDKFDLGEGTGRNPTRRDFVVDKNYLYILGVFGGSSTKGMDLIRVEGGGEYRKPAGFKYAVDMLVPEVFGGGAQTLNPYFPYVDGDAFIFGSPDGLPDGIILVLTSGADAAKEARKRGQPNQPPTGQGWYL
jgi:type II secretory pathway pseudopilin PulG